MSTTKLPQFLHKKLADISRDFWWGFNTDSRHLYLKNWESFHLPKVLAGLGFRNLELMNYAFIMKLAWCIIINPNRWWVQCLLSKYGQNVDFWTVQAQSTTLRLWQEILKTRQWIQAGVCKHIKSGAQTLVYQHIGLPDFTDIIPVSNTADFSCFEANKNSANLLVSDLYDETVIDWNWEKITRLNLLEAARDFLQLTMIQHNVVVIWQWQLSNSGQYTVKSGYKKLFQLKFEHDISLQSNFSSA